jgi:hypothetical protein
MTAPDDLTYLGMVAAFSLGALMAVDHQRASRTLHRVRNSLIVVTIALYAGNIANVKGNNPLGIPSLTGALNCGHGCPDYVSAPGVNPDSFQAFALDALLLSGAVAVGYLVVALIRSATIRGHGSISNI